MVRSRMRGAVASTRSVDVPKTAATPFGEIRLPSDSALFDAVSRRDAGIISQYDTCHELNDHAAQVRLAQRQLRHLLQIEKRVPFDGDPSLDGAPTWKVAAERALRHALSTQDLDSADDGVRGGVAGAFPIWGRYGAWEYLNWAAKFLADLLLGRKAGTPGGTLG